MKLKVNKGLKSWTKKWKKYIFIVVAVSTTFVLSLIMSGLISMGVEIPLPMLWSVIAVVLGILILIFGLIILGYLLLMVKPGGKKGGKK